MKIFTLEEAQSLIPQIKSQLLEIKDLNAFIRQHSKAAKAAAEAARTGGGGMAGGSTYVQNLFRINEIVEQISERGIEVKDFSRGLIDFPFTKNGKIVYLCWQISDGDEIRWWHEIEAGFAGRQRL